jgi:hypothetical protein
MTNQSYNRRNNKSQIGGMPLRSLATFRCALMVITTLSVSIAYQDNAKAKPKTCSEKKAGVWHRCKLTDLSLTPEECKQSVTAIWQRCLQTGTWYGRKQTIPNLKKN